MDTKRITSSSRDGWDERVSSQEGSDQVDRSSSGVGSSRCKGRVDWPAASKAKRRGWGYESNGVHATAATADERAVAEGSTKLDRERMVVGGAKEEGEHLSLVRGRHRSSMRL